MGDLFITTLNHPLPLPKQLDAMNNFLITFLLFEGEYHQQSGRNEFNQRQKQTKSFSIGSTTKAEVDLDSILSSLRMIDLMNQLSSGGYCYVLPHVLHSYFISVYYSTHV